MYSDDKEAWTVKDNWLEKALKDYDPEAKEVALKKILPSFDELYDQFLSVRDLGEGRRRHYEVLRRMIHRYESYIRCSTGRKRYAFDLLKVNKDVFDSLYDYIENENVYVEKFPKILEDNPEAREIKPRSENYNPNLVSALTGHVEGSRVFTRYRTIDMKKDLVKMLEGKQ